jgi:hypothetical protein
MLSLFNQVETKMVLNQPWNYMVNGNWNLCNFLML